MDVSFDSDNQIQRHTVPLVQIPKSRSFSSWRLSEDPQGFAQKRSARLGDGFPYHLPSPTAIQSARQPCKHPTCDQRLLQVIHLRTPEAASWS